MRFSSPQRRRRDLRFRNSPDSLRLATVPYAEALFSALSRFFVSSRIAKSSRAIECQLFSSLMPAIIVTCILRSKAERFRNVAARLLVEELVCSILLKVIENIFAPSARPDRVCPSSIIDNKHGVKAIYSW